jgi:hypothetical protein
MHTNFSEIVAITHNDYTSLVKSGGNLINSPTQIGDSNWYPWTVGATINMNAAANPFGTGNNATQMTYTQTISNEGLAQTLDFEVGQFSSKFLTCGIWAKAGTAASFTIEAAYRSGQSIGTGAHVGFIGSATAAITLTAGWKLYAKLINTFVIPASAVRGFFCIGANSPAATGTVFCWGAFLMSGNIFNLPVSAVLGEVTGKPTMFNATNSTELECIKISNCMNYRSLTF